MNDRIECPVCGAPGGVEIVYGQPTDETCERAARGEVHLGGCIITAADPRWLCRSCGHRWGLPVDPAHLESYLYWEMGYRHEDHRYFGICGRCLALFEDGRPDHRPQRCPCRRQPTDVPWPRFHFNERAHLCECCLAEVLPSGQKWEVWFCEECKTRVLEFNHRHGESIIPIGRHSLMHAVGLPASDIGDDRAVEAFVGGAKTLFERMEILHDRAPVVLDRHLRAFELPRGEDIRLSTYLIELRFAREANPEFTKEAAFEDLIRHFEKRLV